MDDRRRRRHPPGRTYGLVPRRDDHGSASGPNVSPQAVGARSDLEDGPGRARPPSSESGTGNEEGYDFASHSKSFAFRFDGRDFRAEGGDDDWYVGHIEVNDEQKPAQIDFNIDDCQCSYKGMASTAIYRWDGGAFVVAAPSPGSPRPARFVQSSGQMMLLEPVEDR